MFNPYVSSPEWPACVTVQDHDQNDVPPECVFHRPPRPYDERFSMDRERDFDGAMHELTVRGSVRFRVKA